MSKTPETDSYIDNIQRNGWKQGDESWPDFARRLELQRDELREALEIVKREFADDSHLRLKPLAWALVDQALANTKPQAQ